MTDQPPTSGEAISLELETGELSLKQLIGTTDTFSGLLSEISRQMLPAAGVRWFVEHLSMSSPLLVEVRPATSQPEVSPGVLNDLAENVIGGLEQVQASAQRPKYFSDAALEKAKSLAEQTAVAGTHVRIRGGSAGGQPWVNLTTQFVANVDQILGTTTTAIGTVEGRLEAFNVHGTTRYFNVYDDLTGERIRCEFGHRIPVAAIGAAAERRVAVDGEIFYREAGEIVRVKAMSLEVFREEEDLPTADEVKGILNH